MAKKGLLESIVSDMLGEGSVSTGDFLDTIEDALEFALEPSVDPDGYFLDAQHVMPPCCWKLLCP